MERNLHQVWKFGYIRKPFDPSTSFHTEDALYVEMNGDFSYNDYNTKGRYLWQTSAQNHPEAVPHASISAMTKSTAVWHAGHRRIRKMPRRRQRTVLRPIDKSKKSNRRCVNCAHYKECSDNKYHNPCARMTICGGKLSSHAKLLYCHTAHKAIDYWNCCKNFLWAPDKTYTEE